MPGFRTRGRVLEFSRRSLRGLSMKRHAVPIIAAILLILPVPCSIARQSFCFADITDSMQWPCR
jgi:hypothetical protein